MSSGQRAAWGIVVAAGTGTRFGGTKQYALLSGRSVLAWSVAAARGVCDGVVVVVPYGDEVGAEVSACGADVAVAGGATRSESVRAGLVVVPASAEIIVVHDAARPLASHALFAGVLDAVRGGADGAICAVAISDTVMRSSGDRVVAAVDRSGLVAVQTPQAFTASALRAAHADTPEGTDDGGVVQAAGGNVVVVPGDPLNLKLTHFTDLVLATTLVEVLAFR